MKRAPQVKPPCARPDCGVESRDIGYCIPHAALMRRRGVPYRRDELDEIKTGNSYAREMDEALEENPPHIVWRQRKGIQVAVSVHDPHTTREKSWA